MSKRHTHIITEKTEILIECPLDSINGLIDLVSGQDVVGKSSGDIVWDVTQQAYQFKTQNTAQGSKGIYLENILMIFSRALTDDEIIILSNNFTNWL